MDNSLNVGLMVLLAFGMVGVVDAGSCFNISPKNNVYLMTGTDLQLNCSLNRSSSNETCGNLMADFDVHKISMKKGSIALPTYLYTYHESDDTLELTVPNVTFADKGTYSCFYGNSTSIYSFKDVQVGEPPGKPENLTCVSDNFENLRCSFLLNKNAVNMPTRWTMEFRIKNGTWTSLPESSCDSAMTTCWWDNKSEPMYTFLPAAEYHIRVMVWNLLGKAISSVVIINSTNIVKPNPLHKFAYNTFNVRGIVELHWDGPSGLVYGGESTLPLDYKIIVISEWDTRTEWIYNTKDASGEYSLKSYRTYNLTHLFPSTKYSVTVQAKPTVAVGSIYLSDPVQIIFNTSNEVSEHTVKVTSGSYTLLDYGEQVHPVLYWKNPARKYWYGPITGYRILVRKLSEDNYHDPIDHIDKRNIGDEPKYTRVAEPLSENISGLAVTGAMKTTISKEESVKVQIKLINSVGVSSNFSEILIPNWSTGQRLMPRWVSVDVMKSVLNISWHMDPDYCKAVTSVTYYWCLADPADPSNSQNVTCRGDFEWVTVNLTSGCKQETGYHIATEYNKTDVKYAVSLNTDQQLSGGMKWENFRFKLFDVPEKPEYTVSVDGTTMNVLIKYRSYHLSEGGRPILYAVVYKECNEGSDCLSGDSSSKSENFSANFSNPQYSIRNLNLGSKYEVYVKAMNRFGSSIAGDPQIIPIPKDDSSPLATVLGAVFVPVIALVILVVIVLLIKRLMRKCKQETKVTIPDAFQPVEEENFCIEMGKAVTNKAVSDHDSGKGSDSPGSSLGQLDPQHKENGVQVSHTSQLKSAGSDTGRDTVEGVWNGGCSSSTLSGYLNVSNQDKFPDQGEITDYESDSKDSPVIEIRFKEKIDKHEDPEKTVLNLDIDEDPGQNDERKKEKKNVQLDSAEYSVAMMDKDKDEHVNDAFVNEESVDRSTKGIQAVLMDKHVQENHSNSQHCGFRHSHLEFNIEGSSDNIGDFTADTKFVQDSSEINNKSDDFNTSATSSTGDEGDTENLGMSHYKNPDEVSLNGSTCSEDSVEGSCNAEEETSINAQTTGKSNVLSTLSDSFLGKHSDDDTVKDTKSGIDKGNISLDSVGMKKLNASCQSGISSLESKSDMVSLESYMKTGFDTFAKELLDNCTEGNSVDRNHLTEKNKREVNRTVKRSSDENEENTRVSEAVV